MRQMQGYSNVITFILGGGRGTRIFPLTRDRSKPALPFGGKYRVIDIPISNCINSQMSKIFVITQFNSKSLHRHVTNAYQFDHFSHGFVDVLAAEQTLDNENWYLGTADAIRRNLKYLSAYPECDSVLILSGDQIYRMDYRQLFEQHRQQNADLTIAMLPVEEEQVRQFGIMKVAAKKDRQRIIEFVEKPTEPEIVKQYVCPKSYLDQINVSSDKKLFLASMGIYLFKRSVLEDYLNRNKDLDFGKDVIPILIKERNVVPFYFDGYWEDIGTIKAFHRANMDLLGTKPAFHMWDPQFPMYTDPMFLPTAYIQNSTIHNTILGDGIQIINSTITNSVIGVRQNIQAGSILENVICLGADYYDHDDDRYRGRPKLCGLLGIGKNCEIRDTIIDKNARIGNNVKIINQAKRKYYKAPDSSYYIDDGIIVIPKETIIPDDTVI